MKYYQEKQKRFYNLKERICKYCGKQFVKRRQNYCSKECQKLYLNLPEVKEEFANKIQRSRIKFLQENPDKHPWKKQSKFRQIPCEFLKSLLRENNIDFIEEYSPFIERNYSIDIAFPDIKLGIEVNGNQHYNKDGQLKEYYQIRNDYFRSQGWKLLEIHYSLVYKEDFILDIIKSNNIEKLKSYTKNIFDYKSELKSLKEKELQIKLQNKENNIKIKNKIIEDRKNLILNSDIDFSKLGWVSKLNKILPNLSHTQIIKFVKLKMPEFYQTCYKRKSNQN